MPRVGADWHSGDLERKGKLPSLEQKMLLLCYEGRKVGEEIWLWSPDVRKGTAGYVETRECWVGWAEGFYANYSCVPVVPVPERNNLGEEEFIWSCVCREPSPSQWRRGGMNWLISWQWEHVQRLFTSCRAGSRGRGRKQRVSINFKHLILVTD